MSEGIKGIGPIEMPRPNLGQVRPGGGPDFKSMLIDSIGEVNKMQVDAEHAINNLALGKTENVTEVMAAVEKADLAFKNLMAIRNKIVDAYREIQQIRM